MVNETSIPVTTVTHSHLPIRSVLPTLCWGAIIGGTVAAIGIHILLTALGLGAGLATFSPLTDANPLASFTASAGIAWTLCALVALAFGGFVAGRFSHSLHSGFAHGVLVWCATLILTLVLVTAGTGMVMGGALKVLGAGLQVGGVAVSGGAAEVAKTALQRNGDQLASFIKEAVQSGPTNAAPNAFTQANREIGFALTKLFAPGNESNSAANREAVIQALSRYAGMSPADATKAVDGWIVSAKNLQVELENLKTVAEEKARVAADVAARNLAGAALWLFFGLLIGLLVTAFSARYGALCAVRRLEVSAVRAGEPDPLVLGNLRTNADIL